MNHLLSIADLSRGDIERIMAVAERFGEVVERDIKKVPTLRGRTVVNLFYESSTRTSSSFELAAKRLSADLVNVRSSGSAIDKGESLRDTIATLSAYDPAAIVIRAPWAGAAAIVARHTTASVVNAGDGKHEHRARRCSTSTPCAAGSVIPRRSRHLDRRRRAAQPCRPSNIHAFTRMGRASPSAGPRR